jgi:multimeric flavodoxin WrbA
MNIVILGGSPKGRDSVTMQYTEYMGKRFPEHTYRTHYVAQRIGRLERNDEAFREVIRSIEEADGVVWGFPLYVMLVHAGYKRFIELVFERGAEAAFRGKYTITLSTSIHFFDHTAHAYIRGICSDLGMKSVGSHSAGMHDLFDPEKRAHFELFLADAFESIKEDTVIAPSAVGSSTVVSGHDTGAAGAAGSPRTGGEHPGRPDTRPPLATGKRIAVIADRIEPGSSLQAMIERFRGAFVRPPELIVLEEEDIRGGCLGCLRCGFDNVCAWEGKDRYIELFRSKVLDSDVVVFAGAVKDRFLSAEWKKFMDRSFFRTHQPSMKGLHTAFIVSGSLPENGKQILDAWMQMHETDYLGIVSDESNRPEDIETSLFDLAAVLVRHTETGFVRGRDFLGIGGTKIFRDEIFDTLRIVFQEDHRYYRKNGFYDFPGRNPLKRFGIWAAAGIVRLPFIRKGFTGSMKTNMLRGYRKILAE